VFNSNPSSDPIFKRSTCSFVLVLSVITCLVCASNFDKGGFSSVDSEHFDKIAHFCVFGLLATLWFRFLAGSLFGSARCIGAIVLTLLYGVVDEWIQYYNPLRSFDAWAWIADLAGSIAAIWVYRNWRLYRWVLETRVFDLCRLKLT